MVLPPIAAAALTPQVHISNGAPLWATAAVAIAAALLGSVVGGLASYQVNVSLENRRREARTKIRRKAKIYTPIRDELVAMRDAVQDGRVLRGIAREEPPRRTMLMAPTLYLWSDLVRDGRAATSASTKVAERLTKLDDAADALNEAIKDMTQRFEERGPKISSRFGLTPTVNNWIHSDYLKLFQQEYDDLYLIGRGPGGTQPDAATADAFIQAWERDDVVRTARDSVEQTLDTFKSSLDLALNEVEDAMQRIAKKYELESARD